MVAVDVPTGSRTHARLYSGIPLAFSHKTSDVAARVSPASEPARGSRSSDSLLGACSAARRLRLEAQILRRVVISENSDWCAVPRERPRLCLI
jgi:hypothetical protein